MSTGAMLWGGAAYNNGILPFKNYIVGEAYTRDGQPAVIKSPGVVAPWMTKEHGILPQFVTLPTWETIPPADIFRVFERGGRNIGTQFPEIGLPNEATLEGNISRLEEPGRPDIRQSNRGPGTGLRIAVPIINITTIPNNGSMTRMNTATRSSHTTPRFSRFSMTLSTQLASARHRRSPPRFHTSCRASQP